MISTDNKCCKRPPVHRPISAFLCRHFRVGLAFVILLVLLAIKHR